MNQLESILKSEHRWTPRAFEHFHIKVDGMKLLIPFWPDAYRTYDFSKTDKNRRRSQPAGTGAVLFGNYDSESIVLVEGEWDLLAAYEAGIENVVTTSGGAGCFNFEMAETLGGKNVSIVFDLDEAGRKGSIKAAELLNEAGCTVRLVELPPELGPKGDVRDLLTIYGGASEALMSLIDKAPIYLSIAETEMVEKVNKATVMSTVTARKIDFLWEPYFARGFVTLVTGDPGVGKSTFTNQLAAVISRGDRFWDGSNSSIGNCLLFSVEDPWEEVLLPRLVRLGADCNRVIAYPEAIGFDNEGIELVKRLIQFHRPVVVVFDPLVVFIGGETDTSRANEVRAKMHLLTKLADTEKIAIIVVRHMRKSSGDSKLIYSGHGSIDFVASARSELMLLKDPEDGNRRLLGHTKSNLGPPGKTLVLQMTSSGLVLDSIDDRPLEQIVGESATSGFANEEASQLSEGKEIILAALMHGPQTKENLVKEAKSAGVSRSTITRCIKKFAKSERITFTGSRNSGGIWLVCTELQAIALREMKFENLNQLEKFLMQRFDEHSQKSFVIDSGAICEQ